MYNVAASKRVSIDGNEQVWVYLKPSVPYFHHFTPKPVCSGKMVVNVSVLGVAFRFQLSTRRIKASEHDPGRIISEQASASAAASAAAASAAAAEP